MLFILAHAFFVSVTHHHKSVQSPVFAAIASVSADYNGGSGTAPESTSDAHCLSCRLQRNFTSNVHPVSMAVQSLQEPLRREASLCALGLPGSCFIFSNRAPPKALTSPVA